MKQLASTFEQVMQACIRRDPSTTRLNGNVSCSWSQLSGHFNFLISCGVTESVSHRQWYQKHRLRERMNQVAAYAISKQGRFKDSWQNLIYVILVVYLAYSALYSVLYFRYYIRYRNTILKSTCRLFNMRLPPCGSQICMYVAISAI